MTSATDRFRLALGLSPLTARLLAARGWNEVEAATEFLFPRLEHAHSPWLLRGIESAVTRILSAVAAQEKILILGDYDADGTLATVILRQVLRSLGAEAAYRLPQRLGAGYGLQPEVFDQAAAAGVGLAITVDTGIREHAALERARALALDVIVTDHHLPPAELPPAFAILNPHQPGCPYPDKSLCGSGVAFKLAHALLERSGKLAGPWPPILRSYLKLVALATVADAVPLLGENRVLTRFGLAALEQPVNPGLRALLAHALRPGQCGVSSQDVAFRIAPRLNAAGRMGAADRVVELFFASSAEAESIVSSLDLLNLQRQQLCGQILAQIELQPTTATGVLVLAGENWHRGVLGIVAGKVLERTRRPVLIVSREGGLAHGSGRAPAGVHLLQALESCRNLFDRFGGHAQAVGFSMPSDRLPALAAAMAAVECAPRPASSGEVFDLDLGELSPLACRELARLEPWGEANPEPNFRARGVRLAQPPVILKERHLKLLVEQGGLRHTALFWNFSGPLPPPDAALDLVFRLETTRHETYGVRTCLMLTELSVSPGMRQAAGN